MTKSRISRTGSFLAREVDRPEKVHRVNIFTKFILVETLGDPPEWLAGTKILRLDNGDHVNRYADGSLEWVQTGVKMEAVEVATS